MADQNKILIKKNKKIMTNNVSKKQAMFTRLGMLLEGDELDGFVLPAIGSRIQVKCKGGILCILSSDVILKAGTSLQGKVVGFENDVPLLAPTNEWLFANQPQNATIICIYPRGVAMDADGGKLIYYEAETLPEHLQNLNEGDQVLVSGLSKVVVNGCTMYKACKLELAPKESKTTGEFEAWTPEQIEKAYKAGISKQWQGVHLGRKCWVNVFSETEASYKGVPIFLEQGEHFPRGCKRAEVLITFISREKIGLHKEVKAKFIQKENFVNSLTAKTPYRRYELPTEVGYVHEDLIREAKSNQELCKAGPYRLGVNIKVNTDDSGIPEFKPAEHNGFKVDHANVVLENSEKSVANSEVICYITKIKNHSTKGYYAYEFTVRIVCAA